jgi:hypothetical protein
MILANNVVDHRPAKATVDQRLIDALQGQIGKTLTSLHERLAAIEISGPTSRQTVVRSATTTPALSLGEQEARRRFTRLEDRMLAAEGRVLGHTRGTLAVSAAGGAEVSREEFVRLEGRITALQSDKKRLREKMDSASVKMGGRVFTSLLDTTMEAAFGNVFDQSGGSKAE